MARISVAICFVLSVLSIKQSCEGTPFILVTKYFNMAHQLYSSIERTNRLVVTEGNVSEIESLKLHLTNKLDRMNNNIENMKDKIITTITDNLKDKISEKVDVLFRYIKDIESSFKIFYENVTNQTIMSKSQLKRFADECTSFSNIGLPRTVELMHESFIDYDYKKNESLISIIAKDSEAADTMCIKGLSTQQLIYDLYSRIAKADAKALMVKLYAYDILKDQEQDNTYISIKIQTEQKHLAKLNSTFEMVKYFMKLASREVWRCNPYKLKKYINYAKLQEIFQGYVISKGDLTKINKLHKFFGNFLTLHRLRTYSCDSFKDERLRCTGSAECDAQPFSKICNGHIRDCRFLSNQVQVCHAPAKNDRRYVWGHLMDTDVYYGQDHNKYCPDTQGFQGLFYEHICYCNCESEMQQQLRYFSLRESTSDIDQNKVVTGVQFVVDNYVFHIRIQQAVLSQEGSTIGNPEWKEITPISYYDLMSGSKHRKHILSGPEEMERYDEWTEWYVNEHVYAVHYNQNKIFLDEFDSYGGELVTGLRFQQAGDALRLEVRMTPFDYATGKLDVSAPDQWKFNPAGDRDRLEVNLDGLGDPSLSKPSTVFSKSNSFVKFRMSDLDKDFGQTTIPFIDLQSVYTISKTPFPLSGVGLIHRHDEKTGGFLAFKINHYDYTPYISFH